MTAVKICGLQDEETVRAACDAGARYLGFVFHEPSPRHLTLDKAASIAAAVAPGVAKVALTCDASPAMLDEIFEHVPIDMFQLHGRETPDRVAEVRQAYGLPVMKAIGVASEADLAPIAEYGRIADSLLIDAKPPASGDVPGGNGISFDWRLITGRRWPVPWLLAGGLTAANVAEAIKLTGAQQVDVSSGVERRRGVKDVDMIREFMSAAQSQSA